MKKTAIDIKKDYFKDWEKFKDVKKDVAERKVIEFHNFFVQQRDRTLQLLEMDDDEPYEYMSEQDDIKLEQLFTHAIGYILTFKQLKAPDRDRLIYIYNKLLGRVPHIFEEDWLKNTPRTLDASKHLLDMWHNAPDRQEAKEKDMVKLFGGKVHLYFVDKKLKAPEKEAIISMFEEVYKLLASSKLPHFDKVFYGDVFFMEHVENHSTAGVYSPSTDNLWFNSTLWRKQPKEVSKETLIHELGHRYYRKVLNAKEKKAWSDFYSVLVATPYTESKAPKIGDSASIDWGFSFQGVKPGEDIIHRILLIGPEHYYFFKNGSGESFFRDGELAQRGYFPTEYSRENPEELFCETLALYSLGALRPMVRHIIETEFENHFVIPYAGHK